jgi:hypothetical protein
MAPYNAIIEYANIDVAVCDIISKKSGVFLDFFDNFYPYVKENFQKNYDKLLDICENKQLIVKPYLEKTGFYGMNVNIDYIKLINKLKQCKQQLN